MSDQDLTIRLKLDRSQAKAANDAFVADQKAGETAVAGAAESAEKQKADAARGTQKQRRDATGRYIADAGREGKASAGAADQGVAGFARLNAASIVALAGMNALLKAAQKVGQAVADAGDRSRKLSDAFASERDKHGELATLMGRQADNNFTLDMARFNAKTGFRADEGRQFLTELYNSGAQYEGKNISKPEFQQYSEQVGQLAVARQIRPDVVGDVAGGVLGFTDFNKHGANASEVATGKVNSALATLGRGKGDNAVLARQFSMLSSSALNEDALKGVFQDSDEVAAVISVAAEKHDAQAAELAKMAGRGLRDFKNPLVAKAGVKPADSFIQAFTKINKVTQAEVTRRQATTPGFKVEDYLRENLKDEGTIDAWNVFLNRGVAGGGFQDRMDFAKENAGVAPAQKLIGESMRGERFLNRQAEAQVKLAEAESAAKNSQVDILRKQVMAELIRKGEINTNASGIKDYLVGSTSFGLLGSGEQVRIDEAAQRKLVERNGGVDDQPWGDFLNFSPLAREGDLRGRMARMTKAGLDPLHDATGPFRAPETAAPAPIAPEPGAPVAATPPALDAGARVPPAATARPPDGGGTSKSGGAGSSTEVVDLLRKGLEVAKETRDATRGKEGRPRATPVPPPLPGAPAVPIR